MHIHADYANYVTDDKPSSGRSVTTLYTTDIGLAYDCTIGAPQRAPTRPHGLKVRLSNGKPSTPPPPQPNVASLDATTQHGGANRPHTKLE